MNEYGILNEEFIEKLKIIRQQLLQELQKNTSREFL